MRTIGLVGLFVSLAELPVQTTPRGLRLANLAMNSGNKEYDQSGAADLESVTESVAD